MKKIALLGLMIVAVILFAAMPSSAVTFADSSMVKVSGEPGNGRIHVRGAPADIDKYLRNIQFCPDQLKYRPDFICANNWPISVNRISPDEAVFQLDMNAMANGQRAFNFKNNGHWSQVIAGKAGENIVVEMSDPSADSEDGRGGCHYTYVGDLAPGSYIPYKPELCGGGNLAAKYGYAPAPAPAAAPPAHTGFAKSEKCSNCDILESVGEVDRNDPPDEQTLQQKARKTLKSVGVPGASGKSLHEKIGEPPAGKNLTSMVASIEHTTAPNFWNIYGNWFRWIVIVLLLIILLILIGIRANQQTRR